MNSAIQSMLSRYECSTRKQYENALKEIMQEVALLGLSRSKFFDSAAFYGGTALRIIYDMDRFSEDLDFSLLKPTSDFTFSPHLKAIHEELSAMGFNVTVEERKKTIESAIESAFIKAGTKEHLIKATVPEDISELAFKNDILKVKIEIDTEPPGGFETEVKTLLLPIPFAVRIYKQPDLFAGKIHAILQRKWKGGRVKGRDYYDFVWYVARAVPVHLTHLEQRLKQSGGWTSDADLQEADVKSLLRKNFDELDIERAKADVEPFLKDPAAIELWSREFFHDLLSKLKVC